MSTVTKPPATGASEPGPGTPVPAGAVPRRLPALSRRHGPGGGPFGNAGMPGEKALNFGPSALRLLRRLQPFRAKLVAIVGLAVGSVALSVALPKLLGRATDILFTGIVGREVGRQVPPGTTLDQVIAAMRASGNEDLAAMLARMKVIPGVGIDFGALSRVIAVGVGLFVASSLLMWLQGYLLAGVVQHSVRDLRNEVEEKLNRLPLPYYDTQPRGELLSRVTNDVDNIAMCLQQTLSQVLTSLLSVVGILIMMLFISPLLTLIALIAVPLSAIVTAKIAKRSQPKFVAQWKHTGALNAQVEEAYTGHDLVKVFGRQREVRAAFDAENEKLFRASFGSQFISGTIMPAMFFIGNLSYVGVAVVGGLRVASGQISLGDVQAFIQYSRQFTQPVTQLAAMANLLQSGVASAERVFDLLDAPEQSPDPQPAATPTGQAGEVEFEHVSFRYAPDTPLIDDLSLRVRPGQTVAIVGPTGAGKTTLVNLIMRFYELDAGRITLDGVDIASMARADLRSRIGMVLQDTWLFAGTIRDNIAYGRPDATEADVLAAARAAYVDRFVHALPDGYDTRIDDEASNVSAGEKQLITIARAFLADPALLILDEATSSVDTRTERLVQQALAALRANRTSFVIAHRLSTIRDADLILVMEHGQIVERGTHRELVQAGGAYQRLYEAQFTAPAVDDEPVPALTG